VNNNEMGVFITRSTDSDIYKDAYDEAQRIIRISDEIRISLEKIAKDEGAIEIEIDSGTNKEIKLTSSKLAKKYGMKTGDLLTKLTELGYLQKEDKKPKLTSKAENIGAEFKFGKHGPYFLWPENLEID
jgi:hypothetical protein